MKPEERDSKEAAIGIPTDSISNQLSTWIKTARKVNPKLRLAIKSDSQTPYKVIKDVMATLVKIKENRYNLITSLEEDPNK
jgi:biopolymer transport protein ExbD